MPTPGAGMVPSTLTPEAAVVGLLVAAVKADGQEVRSELREATLHLERLEPAIAVAPSRVALLVAEAGRSIAARGLEPHVVACAAAVPPAIRLAVFRAALEVAAADGRAAERERAFLALVAKALALDAREAEAAIRARLG
ncbi:MAG TPA: TerB family tellurite resistance protein [Candidatus Thermoplasmatota archaeon]|nr:TerB family tellurite resistance protein [Candidatus Thermoplasmatota archaeon]